MSPKRSRLAVPALLVLPLVLVAACGGGGGGGGPDRLARDVNGDGRIVLLAFGDSITAGRGDGPSPRSQPRDGGYPARLRTLLVDVEVRNAGDPGERASRGVNRIDQVLAANPDVDQVIILEGINDFTGGSNIPSVQDDILTIANRVVLAGAQPILATLTPTCCDRDGRLPTIEALNGALRGYAATNLVPIVDFYQGFIDPVTMTYDKETGAGLIHQDGLHPTPSGYDVMAAQAFLLLG